MLVYVYVMGPGNRSCLQSDSLQLGLEHSIRNEEERQEMQGLQDVMFAGEEDDVPALGWRTDMDKFPTLCAVVRLGGQPHAGGSWFKMGMEVSEVIALILQDHPERGPKSVGGDT